MTATHSASLKPALDRLDDLAKLPPDWDSYGAVAPSLTAVAAARQILDEVARPFAHLGRQVEPWSIGARADGGIQIEWRGAGGALEVHVEPDGTLGYLFETPRDTASAPRHEEAEQSSWSDIRNQLARALTA